MKYTTCLSLVSLATFGCLIPLSAKAQVTPDDSLGNESSVVTPLDSQGVAVDRIDGGATRGANLFHSFQDFNVDAGRGAYFSNPTGINNIFSRVTGTSISNINGVLGVLGNANLFLINPNGIIFGQNASLNLGGSFFASTADSLLFEGNTEFSAVNPQAAPLLAISIPIGLNFRDNPEDIVNSSIANGFGLSVNQENIALIGGDVTLNNGNITAPGGKVELGGLNASGTIGINADGSLSFPENIEKSNVFLRNSSKVNLLSRGGGSITINSKNLEITEGSLFIAGIGAGLGSKNAQAGDIVINATDKIIFDGAVANGLSSGIYNFVDGLGNTGEIKITTSDLSLTNGGKIESLVTGSGNSGDITIQASDRISLDGARLINYFD